MNKEKDLFEKTFDELWKTEEYNFGTTDEDGWNNFDDYTEYPFAIEEMSILADEYNKIKRQLQSYKDKEDKIKEYITSYESISIIQGLNDIIKNKDLDEKTMIEMTNRYLEVHDKLLQILNEGDK